MGNQARHVVFFDAYPNMYAGTARSVELLAQRLPALGYTAEIVLPDEGTVADRLRAAGADVTVVRVPPCLRVYGRGTRGLALVRAVFALPRYWWRLRRHLSARGGIVHVTSHRSVILAAPAAKLARLPVFWLISQIEDDRVVSVLCDLLATRTIACSAAADAALPALGRRRRVPHTIVPFPVDPRFDDVPVAEPQRPPVVVTTGRLEPSKGQLLLLEAFAIVLTKVPDARLRIIGGDQPGHEAYAAQVRQRAAALGPPGTVEVTGWADRPEELMRDATLYVCCSRIEGLGIAIVEAMACGLPVVITANTGMAEFVEDGRSALIVPNDDPAAMADSIVRLLADPCLAARIAGAGREVTRQFALDNVAKATAAVLDDMLADATATP